jgi:hypothetical protein
LIALDDGPFFIFANLRGWTDKRAEREQIFRGKIWQSINDGLHCPFCVGIWIAAFLAVVHNGISWYTLIYSMAIAGAQSFLEGLKK